MSNVSDDSSIRTLTNKKAKEEEMSVFRCMPMKNAEAMKNAESTAATRVISDNGPREKLEGDMLDQPPSERNDEWLPNETCWKEKFDQEYLRFFSLQRTLFYNAIRGIGENAPSGCSSSPRVIILSGTAREPKHQLAMSILHNNERTNTTVLLETDDVPFLDGGTGKFHPTTSLLPYHAILTALEEWVHSLVSTLVSSSSSSVEKEKAQRVCETLQELLHSDEWNVLTSVMPYLANLMTIRSKTQSQEENGRDQKRCAALSSESEISPAPKANSQQRFILAFCHLMRVIAGLESSISEQTIETRTAFHSKFALVLEDLHAAGPCSLDLLTTIVADQLQQHNFDGEDALAGVTSGKGGLVVVATCDDSVVDPGSYLAVKLRDMETTGVCIQNISLEIPTKEGLKTILENVFTKENLGWINDQWMDVFQATLTGDDGTEDLIYLMKELWVVAQGDFHTEEAGKLLQSKLLSFFRNDGSVDLAQIRRVVDKRRATNVGSEEGFHHVLKVCACFGFSVDACLIAQVTNVSMAHLLDVLDEAVENGILTRTGIPKKYSFSNEKVYSMVYEAISPGERDSFHMDLGFSLWKKSINNKEVDQSMFLILSQLIQGQQLIAKSGKTVVVATLCLHAGREAAKLSAFRKAIRYLNFGIRLLPSRHWRDHYELALSLFCAAAELELLQGHFDSAEEKLQEVFKNARSLQDAIHAHGTHLLSLSMQDRQQECLDVGIELLKQLGERLPKRLFLPRVILEIQAVEKLLKGKSDEDLRTLPPISHADKLSALTLLEFMIYPAISARPLLGSFIFVRFFRITLQYGMNPFAGHAFVLYAMVVHAATGDVHRAARLADLGWNMLEESKAMEFMPRLATGKYGCIYHFCRPVRECLGPLFQSYKVGAQLGDFEFACMSGALFTFQAFDAGIPLDIVSQCWNQFERTMIAGRQDTILLLTVAGRQCMHHYMGVTENPLSPVGDLVDYDQLEVDFAKSGVTSHMVTLRVNRMRLGYFFGDYEMAEKYAITLQQLHLSPPTTEKPSAALYLGLLCLAMTKRRKLFSSRLSTAKKIINLFKEKWARDAPENYSSHLFLLEAELAAVRGKFIDANDKFERAIEHALQSRSYFMIGISNERMAKYQARLGNEEEARLFFLDAIDAYGHWNAYGKQRHLQKEFQALCGN